MCARAFVLHVGLSVCVCACVCVVVIGGPMRNVEFHPSTSPPPRPHDVLQDGVLFPVHHAADGVGAQPTKGPLQVPNHSVHLDSVAQLPSELFYLCHFFLFFFFGGEGVNQ